MSAQLELDLSRSPRAARAAGSLARRAQRSLGALLRWAPVWAPLLLAAQVLGLGWWPARAERARLDRAEAEVRARVERLRAEEAELRTQERMLGDAIYQERVRRSLVDPAAQPLTLERARTIAGR